MWLPDPIYECLPYLYLAMGALLLGGAIYIGLGIEGMPYYLGLGFLSILGGVVIHLRRSTERKHKANSELSESP